MGAFESVQTARAPAEPGLTEDQMIARAIALRPRLGRSRQRANRAHLP
jgi:hypothetical protein